MNIVKALFRVLIGALLGLASAIALIPATGAFTSEIGSGDTAWMTWVIVAIGAILGFFAPTIRRAFGRGFLLLGVSVFALPLSMMLLSGRVASDMISAGTTDMDRAGAAFGAGVAGTVMTGAAAFIGFFLGAIFLIIGLVLVLGGRREVVVIQQPSYGASYVAHPQQPDHPMIDATPCPNVGDAAAVERGVAPQERVEPKF